MTEKLERIPKAAWNLINLFLSDSKLSGVLTLKNSFSSNLDPHWDGAWFVGLHSQVLRPHGCLAEFFLFFPKGGPEGHPDEGRKISSRKTSAWLCLPASLDLLNKILQQFSLFQSWTLTIPAKECQKCCSEQTGACNNTGIHRGITQQQSPGTGMIVSALRLAECKPIQAVPFWKLCLIPQLWPRFMAISCRMHN